MNYTQIDLAPVKPGYGLIWQGNLVDEDIFHIPGPLVIVEMTKGTSDHQWLAISRGQSSPRSGGPLQGVITVGIDDYPDAVLPDAVYLGLVDACCGYLRNGINLYVHCRMGLSRSTYLTAGIHTRLGMSLTEALKMIGQRRKEAFPNWGFFDQLHRLEFEGKLGTK